VFGRAVWSSVSGDAAPFVHAADYLELREESRSFEAFAAVAGSGGDLTGMSILRAGGASEYVASGIVSYNFFEAAGVQPILGRTFERADEDSPRVVVLTHRMWSERFGQDPSALGKVLSLDGEPFTVVGVMPPGFAFPRGAQLWTTLPLGKSLGASRNNPWAVQPVGRLRDGVAMEGAQKELDAISRKLARTYPATNAGVRMGLMPAREALLGSLRFPALTFSIAAVCLLLVSVLNTAQLNIARVAGRLQEVQIRIALGARWPDIFRLLLREMIVLCLIAGCLGAGGAALLERQLPNLGLAEPDGGSGHVLIRTAALAIGTALITSLVAAGCALLVLIRSDTTSLRTRTAVWKPMQRLFFRSFTIGQLALAFALTAGAGLLVETIWRLSEVKPGFDPSNTAAMLLTFPPAEFPTRESRIGAQRLILDRVRSNAEVAAAGVVDALPQAGSTTIVTFQLPETASSGTDQPYTADVHLVSPGALETMGVPLLQGRMFEERDAVEYRDVILINRELARLCFPGRDAVGQSLSFGAGAPGMKRPQVIAGVVGDVRHRSLEMAPGPAVYKATYALSWVHLIVRKRAGSTVTPAALRERLLGSNPDLPRTELVDLPGVVRGQMQPRLQRAYIVAAFTLATVLLACFGVFASAAHSVSQRAVEFAIRKAVGATDRNIEVQIVRETAMLALPGFILGAAISLGLGKIASAGFYGVTYYDPAVYAAATLLLSAALLAACAVPAKVAGRTRADEAFRVEV
jgi:predicted permease